MTSGHNFIPDEKSPHPPMDEDDEAYSFIRAERSESLPLIVTCPHAGRAFPDQNPYLDGMVHELDRRGDTYTDALVAPGVRAANIMMLASRIAPAYVNVGRSTDSLFAQDIRGGLAHLQVNPKDIYAQSGQGLISTRSYHTGDWVFKKDRHPDADEIAHRVKQYHAPYQQVQDAMVKKVASENGLAFLFDVHSCPSSSKTGGEISSDIILSNADGLSCHPKFMEVAVLAANAAGFSVQQNEPYKGGFATQKYGMRTDSRNTEFNTQSLQIEWNRLAYGLNEQTLEIEDTDKFIRAQNFMTVLIAALSEEAKAQSGHLER